MQTVLIIIVVVLILAVGFDFSKTSNITGLVADTNTSLPVPDAIVWIKYNGKTSFSKTIYPGSYGEQFAVTDANGKYILEGIRPYLCSKLIKYLQGATLTVCHPQYHAVTDNIDYTKPILGFPVSGSGNDLGSHKTIIKDIALDPAGSLIKDVTDLERYYRQIHHCFSPLGGSIISSAFNAGIRVRYRGSKVIETWQNVFDLFPDSKTSRLRWPALKYQVETSLRTDRRLYY